MGQIECACIWQDPTLWKAVGWFSIWPEKRFPIQPVTVSETLMRCHGGLRAI